MIYILLVFFTSLVQIVAFWVGLDPENNKAPYITAFFFAIIIQYILLIIEYNKNKKHLDNEASKTKHTVSKINELTGEGSFPFAFLGGGLDGGNKTQVCVQLRGDYAIQNITLGTTVIPDYSKVSGLDIRVAGLNNSTNILGTLRKNEFHNIFATTLTNETALLLKLKSDNNSWNIHILINKSSGNRESLIFVKSENGETLYKNISDNFPKNQNGKIQIWSNVEKNYEEI